jgi:nicotinamide riboside transporter PnuC
MPYEMWGYILILPSVTATWLQGKGCRWGWALAIVNQCLWIVVALVTHQPGIILLSIAYAGIYGYNLRKWTREMRRKEAKRARKLAKKRRSDDRVQVPVPGR